MTFRPVTIEDGRVVEHREPTPEAAHETTVVVDGRTFQPDRAASGAEQHAYLIEIGQADPRAAEYLRTIAHGLRMCARTVDDLRARLAAAETALADRDRHFQWDDRLRMEREIGDLAAERDRLRGDVQLYGRELAAHRQALATTYPALRRIVLGHGDRVTEEQVRDLLDWCDRQGIVAPSTGTTPA